MFIKQTAPGTLGFWCQRFW